MSQPKTNLTDGLLALAEVALVDLPAAVTLRAFKAEMDGELQKAGWKAYEAATGVVTDLTNRAYANRPIASFGARIIERSLKTQRVVDAFAGAFFSALWPSIGLPDDYFALIAPPLRAFIGEGKRTVAHGGICIEEVIVPFVTVVRSA